MPHAPHIGRDLPRKEGEAALRGAGCYVSDVALPADALALVFRRSAMASAEVSVSALDRARAMPGVVAVLTAADLPAHGALEVNPIMPVSGLPDWPILAPGRVSAAGQPVAAVLAGSRAEARAAAETLEVAYTPQPAPAPAPMASRSWRAGDPEAAFAAAAHVVEVRSDHALLAPSPMEPRAIAVAYHAATEGVTAWCSTQTPHRARASFASILQVDPARIRVVAPDVGGAFGMKASVYPEEVLAVWAALSLKRSVRWVATRSEEFASASRGRGLRLSGRLALDGAGRFLALAAEVTGETGHWLSTSALVPPYNAARMLPTGYDVPALDIRTEAEWSAAPPVGIYRGAGRPEAVLLMERLVDRAAVATGLDRAEIRRRNLVPSERMPHAMATGGVLDSGDYPALMARIAPAWEAALAWRDAARAAGEAAGVGLAFYLEPSGEGWESARVTLESNGGLHVASGSSAQGQGRATTLAQIAADAAGVEYERVRVSFGDTGRDPEGIGAVASRSTAIGGSAVCQAASAVAERAAAGEALPIVEERRYENSGQAWGAGVCVARLSVDLETGKIALHRLDCLDDAGRIVSPALAHGQIRGGLAQGVGEALLERVVDGPDGAPLTDSFQLYAMPRAVDMPAMALDTMESPSPTNLLGAKGLGEGGTVAAPPAILSAALDALAPHGVGDLQMPLSPARVWAAIQSAKGEPR